MAGELAERNRVGAMPFAVTMLFHCEEREPIIIRCKTRQSAINLFTEIRRYHRYGHDHPFIR